MSIKVLPRQAETQVMLDHNGYVTIWQESLTGNEEAIIEIHRDNIPRLLEVITDLLRANEA